MGTLGDENNDEIRGVSLTKNGFSFLTKTNNNLET